MVFPASAYLLHVPLLLYGASVVRGGGIYGNSNIAGQEPTAKFSWIALTVPICQLIG